MWNEFLPISIPMTAIALAAVADMSVLLFAPSASVVRWWGRNTAGPSH